MKRILFITLFLLSLSHLWAQTEPELSPEEKAKREKNIQAGNPFKRFGYTPKIATLSKGKYLEFHDLDSVVRIGSFSYHVKHREIVGYTAYDTIHPESSLRPDLMSRWISPDPLSEEFPSWSPYVYTNNNPIRFIDPTGLATEDFDTDFILDKKTGHITRKDPNDGSEKNLNDRLFATDENGNATENYLQINKENASDKTLISNMTTENIWEQKTSYADDIPITIETNISISTSKTDAFNFFKFVADNSNTEWSLHKFGNGKQDFYQLGTYHNTYPYSDTSPGFLFWNNSGFNWKGSVHSHFNPTKLSDSGFLGDFGVSNNYRENFGKQYPYLIYHPNVKGKPTVNVVYGQNRVISYPTIKF